MEKVLEKKKKNCQIGISRDKHPNIPIKETEFIFKYLSKKKNRGPDV